MIDLGHSPFIHAPNLIVISVLRKTQVSR